MSSGEQTPLLLDSVASNDAHEVKARQPNGEKRTTREGEAEPPPESDATCVAHAAHLHHFGRKHVRRIVTLERDRSNDFALVRRPVIHQFLLPDGALVRHAEERKASWNEAFFDLTFVVVVARLTHAFRLAPSWPALAWYAMMFSTVWVLWRDVSWYINKFESDDVLHKLFFVVLLACVTIAGVHMPRDVALSAAGAPCSAPRWRARTR